MPGQYATIDGMAGRFAPSPTSPLHLGNLRTALVAWLAARSSGREVLLRIEDLDQQRVSAAPAVANAQIADLQSLGLDFDGDVVWQSSRLQRYAAAVAGLPTYECFCTRREIAEAASAPHGDGYRPYPGTCAHLSDAERAERVMTEHVLEARDFREEDFALSHPGGSLGRRLLVRMRDVMRQGDALPVVAPEVTVAEATREISRGGIGIAIVVDGCGHVIGVFTDGDLRRTIVSGRDLATLAVADKEMPGFGEEMRRISLNFVPTAILSRQVAVIRKQALIINLPGQPKSIRETLEGVRAADGTVSHVGIFAAVPYCLDLIGGPYAETNEAVIKAFRPKSAIRSK